MTRRFFNGRNSQHTICVEFKSNGDLWLTTWHGRNTLKHESTKKVVILDESTLTLKDRDVNLSLLILNSGESLGLLDWDVGVAINNGSHDTTNRLNTESQWGDVDQQNVMLVAAR